MASQLKNEEKVKKIVAPQITFEGGSELDKFVHYFLELYRIEIFKDGLDLILTKLHEKHLRFEIKQIQGWDTNVGCFLTEQRSFYNKTLGKFLNKNSPKIILRKLSHNVLAHEMAHALEFESGVDLGEEFRKCIGLDMKNREPELITLKSQKQRLMVEALKTYPKNQFISELFARYFELLSVSRDVCQHGDFATNDVEGFFVNTTNFIVKIFNSKIRLQVNMRIAEMTSQIVEELAQEKAEINFSQKVGSFQKKNLNSWSKSVKSNAMWQEGFLKNKIENNDN